MKKKYYSVHADTEYDLDDITFYKNKEDGLVYIQMYSVEMPFSVKSAKEIISKLKKCCSD